MFANSHSEHLQLMNQQEYCFLSQSNDSSKQILLKRDHIVQTIKTLKKEDKKEFIQSVHLTFQIMIFFIHILSQINLFITDKNSKLKKQFIVLIYQIISEIKIVKIK
jgi:hypothetical protein